MVNQFITSLLRPLLALAFLLLAQIASAGTLTATVDRKVITENDTFRLFLRYDEQVGYGQPDLTVLKKDFRVLSQQRSNQFRSMNGKTVSFTEWTLMLSPIKTGTLIIPAVEFDGQFSQEIQVTVNELSQTVKDQIAKEFFFDIDVDRSSTYVQAQIIYTEKLYYSVNHEDATLSEFKVTDAHVIPLGEVRQYNTNINGQRMGVYERRFAIFAEESGELVIPGQRFTANIVNSYNRWSRGRPVSIVAKPIRIEVKSTPSTYPQAPWLPSPQLTIADRWSKPYSEWQVGEPVTRTITLNAQGLSGSQLPKINLTPVDGLKYYPDQSEHNDKTDPQGIYGYLQQSIAIVPTQSGRITIPEMRIPWWDLETNRLEYAILPTQTINVAPAASATIEAGSDFESDQTALTEAPSIGTSPSVSGYWVAATLFLLLSNIITAFLLWRRQGNVIDKTTDLAPASSSKEKLKQVKKACQKNNPLTLRQALKEWSQQEFGISGMDQLGQQLNHIALSNSLNELESVLYQNGEDSAFNGQLLWNNLSQALKKNQMSDSKIAGSKIESSQTRRAIDRSELSPLYNS